MARQHETGAARKALLQRLEIARRVVQAIGMVDAQAVDHPGRGEVERKSLRRLEHFLPLHAQGRQFVDVEKAPVVDVVGGHAPVRQSPGLGFDQRMQRVALAFAVQMGYGSVDGIAHGGLARCPAGKATLEQFLVARALDQGLLPGRVAMRQVAERGGHAGKAFGQIGIVDALAGRGQHQRITVRRQRKPVLVIAQHQASRFGLEGQHQFAARQRVAVVIAQHGHQHLAGQLDVEREPIDVEMLCE